MSNLLFYGHNQALGPPGTLVDFTLELVNRTVSNTAVRALFTPTASISPSVTLSIRVTNQFGNSGVVNRDLTLSGTTSVQHSSSSTGANSNAYTMTVEIISTSPAGQVHFDNETLTLDVPAV